MGVGPREPVLREEVWLWRLSSLESRRLEDFEEEEDELEDFFVVGD
jgi:hypothetical protein